MKITKILIAFYVIVLVNTFYTRPVIADHSLDAADGSPTNAVYVDNNGNVGIGTTSPKNPLHIFGAGALVKVDSPTNGQSVLQFSTNGTAKWAWYIPGGGSNFALWHYPDPQQNYLFFSGNTGNVGIGTTSPAEKLHVAGDIRLDAGGDIAFADDNTRIRESSNDLYLEADDDLYLNPDDDIFILPNGSSGNRVGIGTSNPSQKLHVAGTIYSSSGGFKFPDGSVQTSAATGGSGGGLSLPYTGSISRSDNAFSITNTGSGKAIYAKGGSGGYAAEFLGKVKISNRISGATVIELGEGLDYAEGFNISNEDNINPGSVLVIDPDNPGKLTLSTRSYDKKVAGIVAGAKGLGSGVRLGTGQFDCDMALAGRVYCNVDATEVAIEPGDLLTTSTKPGYAAKVVDYTRAQGAILGKAMEKMEKGNKGQILVLVTLQ